MQDPVRDIAGVVKGLVHARNATTQRDMMEKYFAPDASSDHVFAKIVSNNNSRDTGILPIYQWYRCMFTPRIEVRNIGFDKEANKLFLDAQQTLQPNLFPFSLYAPTVRLLVVLFLQRGADGRFYIKRQEDYYQLQDLPGKLIPGGDTVVNVMKRLAAFQCLLLALLVRLLFGYWRPISKA